MILLFLATIEINLYTSKDIYLIGEDIWVRWEIINSGDSIGYIEKGGLSNKLWRYYFERCDSTGRILLKRHLRIWDKNKDRIPYRGPVIKGSIVRRKGSKFKIRKPGMNKIEAGDTIKSKEANLIEYYGNLEFEGGLFGRGRGYFKQGEYYASLVLRTMENDKIVKIWSDTVHFSVKEPADRELVAWSMYKSIRKETRHGKTEGDKTKAIRSAYYILKRVPNSNYAGSIMHYLIEFFGYIIISKEKEEFKRETKELINYLENNIDKFAGKKMTFNSALWCIIKGEFMLLSPYEKVLNFIRDLDFPVDKEILEYFGIEENE